MPTPTVICEHCRDTKETTYMLGRPCNSCGRGRFRLIAGTPLAKTMAREDRLQADLCKHLDQLDAIDA